MGMFTSEALAAIGFEGEGVYYYVPQQLSLEDLQQALGGTMVLKPHSTMPQVSFEISIDFMELFASISPDGVCSESLLAVCDTDAPIRAAWIKGEIVGASAGSVEKPDPVDSADFVGLVDFAPEPDSDICAVWLQLQAPVPVEGMPALGTAEELLSQLT